MKANLVFWRKGPPPQVQRIVGFANLIVVFVSSSYGKILPFFLETPGL
jgi:hypothetical protein